LGIGLEPKWLCKSLMEGVDGGKNLCLHHMLKIISALLVIRFSYFIQPSLLDVLLIIL